MAIRVGDDFDSFGSSSAKRSKAKQRRTSLKISRKHSQPVHPQDNNSGFYGFDDIGRGSLCNPFGEEIQEYDVRVSWDALSALSDDGRISPDEFEVWINDYLQLQWNEPR